MKKSNKCKTKRATDLLLTNSIIILIISLLLITTTTYAANDTFDTTIQVNSNKVKRDDNVVVTTGLKNIAIESGDKGIGAYTAKIKFDSSVLEYVSTSGTDKWEAPLYQDGLIVGNTKDGEVVDTAQGIGTITFKVKEDAKAGNTTIELTEFLGSTAVADVEAPNTSVDIMVEDSNKDNNKGDENNNGGNSGNGSVKQEENGESGRGNNNNNGANNKNSNMTQGSTNIKERKDNTIANERLPKTGKQSFILIACIGVIMLCSVYFYIKMRK